MNQQRKTSIETYQINEDKNTIEMSLKHEKQAVGHHHYEQIEFRCILQVQPVAWVSQLESFDTKKSSSQEKNKMFSHYNESQLQ